jgi:hypothetical protein
MDKRVIAIDTPEKCAVFAKNAISKGRDDLAMQASARTIELRAKPKKCPRNASLKERMHEKSKASNVVLKFKTVSDLFDQNENCA